MGLVGPNGAGKTTIIKLIMSLIKPDGGGIENFGLDHLAHEKEVKGRIGFVYDVPPVYGDVSLRDTKRAIALFYEKWNEALFNDLVSQFQLPKDGKGPFWAFPVVCGGRLYLRHGEFLYAYDIRLK